MGSMTDQDYDPIRLADLIHRDQAFTGHLMRVANSPMFGARSKIVSLRQALAQLGIRKVSEITFFIACRSTTFDVGELKNELEGTFPHAYATAQFAQAIGKAANLHGEELFLAGLLHDLGRPVLLQAAVSIHRKNFPETAIDRQATLAAVDLLHARASKVLAESWRLPQSVSIAIAHHHSPEQTNAFAPYAYAVALADELSHATMEDGDLESLCDHPSAGALGLRSDKMKSILAGADAIREAARAMGA